MFEDAHLIRSLSRMVEKVIDVKFEPKAVFVSAVKPRVPQTDGAVRTVPLLEDRSAELNAEIHKILERAWKENFGLEFSPRASSISR